MAYKVALLIGLLSVLAYRLYCRQRQRSEVARNYGCGTVVQHRPLEPFTGFDFQMRMHVTIPFLHRLHQRYGHTFQVGTLVSHPAIITVAKENLHAINTSNEFGVEPMRLPGMEYFCGKGFITTDGDTWNHSKRLLRPSFDRSNLRDLSILRDEVDTLIKSLPKDGSVADLQPLLYTTVSLLEKLGVIS
jgi:cytochrome P450